MDIPHPWAPSSKIREWPVHGFCSDSYLCQYRLKVLLCNNIIPLALQVASICSVVL